ncbi:TlpA family protein disulfide reductase [Nocardioides donggukensis]|uniref:Redoxin family protein n=1 Tax=Nocardioides donggukensis TaxID=2774019 RepID=A0A927K2F2_9ACTN|nr:redoxin family protein [Nocardioides donggukensis]MBD8868774.1 redoxin family protein [Nocardioides donggukensis]
MLKTLLALATAVLLALLAAGCGTTTSTAGADDAAAAAGDSSAESPESSEGDEAADEAAGGSTGDKKETGPVPAVYSFDGTTLAGADFRGASLRGEPSVLWFWAPWCPTCVAQQSVMTELAEEYAAEVGFVGVAGLDDDEQAMAEFAGRTSGEITHLQDSVGDVWRHFGVRAQSSYVVLDGRGKVAAEGSLSDDELRSVVSSLAG